MKTPEMGITPALTSVITALKVVRNQNKIAARHSLNNS